MGRTRIPGAERAVNVQGSPSEDTAEFDQNPSRGRGEKREVR